MLKRLGGWAAALTVLAAAAFGTACLVDDDARCGANQIFNAVAKGCACAEGYEAKGRDCVAVVIPDAGGDPADAGGVSDGGAGDAAPVASGPTGDGQTCSTNADCAGKDAKVCESVRSHMCRVSCMGKPNGCHTGSKCCPLSMFGGMDLCLPNGECPF